MKRDETQPPAIRDEYQQQGARTYYEKRGNEYRNPHEDAVRDVLKLCVDQWRLDLRDVLDLACGSGEVTLALREFGAERVCGVDPFTADAYRRRTGRVAERHTFEEIAAGCLSQQCYRLIVCSYAMHLLEESRLPGLMHQLAQIAPALLILTPHKRPAIKSEWGWNLRAELYQHRVRARLYDRLWPADLK